MKRDANISAQQQKEEIAEILAAANPDAHLYKTPLLPTDEEIEEKASSTLYYAEGYSGFVDGAKWMRELLLSKIPKL
jgi:hypothetical protein